jgi:TatD DNase family protein
LYTLIIALQNLSAEAAVRLKFVDAHIHLSDSEYKNRVDEIIMIARQVGVVAMVTNSTDLETSKRSLELAEKYTNLVYAAVGIHPWNANQFAQSELQGTVDFIVKNALKGRIVAVGEIGLDPKYAKRKEMKEQQTRVFTEMVQLAEKLAVPIIIHSRWSAQKITDMLSSYRLRGVLWHWLSDPSDVLSRIIERGDYISEGPPVSYSDKIQEIVKQAPLERLLTETDGPVRYYGPLKDTPTTPALIPQTVKTISQVKKIDESHVAQQILDNFSKFFGVKLEDCPAI